MELFGHRHCGAVSYTVSGDPVRMAQCHCNACRRTSGTGHSAQAFFRHNDVTITGQTTACESLSDRGSKRTRYFCPICGSGLFSENERSPDLIGIAVGTLDDSSWFAPAVAHYAAERPAWDAIDPALDTHERN